MNHECRTPLNAILGFAEVLANDLNQTAGTERQRGYVAAIYEGGRRLSGMLDNILEMARIEAGKVELVESETPIAAVIASVVRLIRSEADKAQLRIDTELDEDPVVLVDERAMRRILLNLLLNAIKFSRAGGHVRVAMESDPSGGIAITIADTGVGIAKNEIALLLEPFTQSSDDLARRYEGGGLGLPIAKGLLELHDGRLQVESELGVGTTVKVILPPFRVMGKIHTEDATILDLESEQYTPGFDESLLLVFGDQTVVAYPGSGNCVIGRNREKPNEVKCDIVVNDQRVSRPHARIRYEEDGFYLFDQSRRGTYVVSEDGKRSFACQDAPIRLGSEGLIYLGIAPEEPGAQPVRFQRNDRAGAQRSNVSK